MANPNYYLCDICGASVPKECRVHLATGRQMDPAGSMDDVGFHADFCGTCCSKMLALMNVGLNGVLEEYAIGHAVEDYLKKFRKTK